MVPYRQGMSWIRIDQGKTAQLWGEALERSADRPQLEGDLFQRMLREARLRPSVRQFCIGVAARSEELAGLLMQGWPVEILHEEEEEISSALQKLGDGRLLERFKALIMRGSQTQGERP